MFLLMLYSYSTLLSLVLPFNFCIITAQDIGSTTSAEKGSSAGYDDILQSSGELITSTVKDGLMDYTIPILNLSWSNIQQISDTSVQNYAQITFLDLSGNPLSSIESLSSSTIEELKLEQGHLRKIKGLDKLPNLKKLSLSNNRHLTVFDAFHSSLKIVNISHCGLTQLNLKGLPNITTFVASDNRITSIDESNFASNNLIEYLDLSQNEIVHIDDYSFIRNNRLKYLNLADNKIAKTDWTLALKTVHSLNLSRNLITNIDLLLLPKAINLDISDNFIENLPENLERLLPSLSHLDVHSNSIRVIKNLKSSVLKSLNLRDCKLQELSPETFLGTPSLQDLDLSDNKLQSLDFVQNLQNYSNVVFEGNLWNCQCNLTTKIYVLCSPSGLTYTEFCGSLATEKDYEPWFMHAANPVFWAPPVVALCVLVIGCFGLRGYRRCKARVPEEEAINRKSMDLLQNVEIGGDRFDDELIKKLLRERLSRRFPRRLSYLSEASETEGESG